MDCPHKEKHSFLPTRPAHSFLYNKLFNKEQNNYFLFILPTGFTSLKIMFAHTLILGEWKSADTNEPLLKLLADMHTDTHHLEQKIPCN